MLGIREPESVELAGKRVGTGTKTRRQAMTRKNGNKATAVAETVEAGFINPIAAQLAAAGFIIPDQGGVAEEQEALKAVTQAEGRAESPVAVMGTSKVKCLRRAVQAAQATLTLGEELAGERASLRTVIEAGQQERSGAGLRRHGHMCGPATTPGPSRT